MRPGEGSTSVGWSFRRPTRGNAAAGGVVTLASRAAGRALGSEGRPAPSAIARGALLRRQRGFPRRRIALRLPLGQSRLRRASLRAEPADAQSSSGCSAPSGASSRGGMESAGDLRPPPSLLSSPPPLPGAQSRTGRDQGSALSDATASPSASELMGESWGESFGLNSCSS